MNEQDKARGKAMVRRIINDYGLNPLRVEFEAIYTGMEAVLDFMPAKSEYHSRKFREYVLGLISRIYREL